MERVKCVVYVVCDGRKYKLRMSTPPEELTIAKVKQTLQKPTGWSAEEQNIEHKGILLQDSCTIASLQLQSGEALQLVHNSADSTPPSPHAPPPIEAAPIAAVHPPPIPVHNIPTTVFADPAPPQQSFTQADFVVPPPHLDAFQAFFVRDDRGKTYRVPAQGDVQLITMDQIKGYVAAVSGIPLHRQQLFFNGIQVLGYQTSAQVGIRPGDTLQLVAQPESPQTIFDSRQIELANLLEQERLQREIERLEELRASIGQRHTISSLSTQSVRLSTPAVIQGTLGNPQQQFYPRPTAEQVHPLPPEVTRPTSFTPTQEYAETFSKPSWPPLQTNAPLPMPLPIPAAPVIPVMLPSMVEEQELIRREEEIKALARVEELERLRRIREREVQEIQKAKNLEVELARMELEREQRRNQELDRINAEKRAQLREQQRLDEERRRVEEERERLKTERMKMDKFLFTQEMDYNRREIELEEERKLLLQRQHELLRDAAVAETGSNPRASPAALSEGLARSSHLHLGAHSTPPDSPHYHRSVSRQSLFPAESPGLLHQHQQYWSDPDAELNHLVEHRHTPAYRSSPYVH